MLQLFTVSRFREYFYNHVYVGSREEKIERKADLKKEMYDYSFEMYNEAVHF